VAEFRLVVTCLATRVAKCAGIADCSPTLRAKNSLLNTASWSSAIDAGQGDRPAGNQTPYSIIGSDIRVSRNSIELILTPLFRYAALARFPLAVAFATQRCSSAQ
jgi:hypothetical protein